MYISIIADSKRHEILAERLKKDGHTVNLYDNFSKLPDKISADLVVFPIPSFTLKGNLNLSGSPDYADKQYILSLIDKKSLIISCNFEVDGGKYIDINKYEPFVSMNAVPSAEGAVKIAMDNSDITLFNSNSAVIGYGRIGKILADRLSSFKANVTVIARNPKDRYAAVSSGLDSMDYPTFNANISKFDFIFQTVPFPVLTEDNLPKVKGLIIELSSKCIGTDSKYAEKNGIRMIYAPGIPEKYSCTTAGIILYDSIKSIISEL